VYLAALRAAPIGEGGFASLPLGATPAALAELLAASCAQLTLSRPSTELAQQAAKNALALCLLLHTRPELCPPPGSAAAAALRALGADTTGGKAAAADAGDEADDQANGATAAAAATAAVEAEAEQVDESACCWAVRVVCRRLGTRCREPSARAASLRLFGALGAHLEPAAVGALLPSVLRALLFSAGDKSGKVDAPTREVAASVMQLLQERAGDELYLRAYADARHALAEAKQSRIARLAVEAITDTIGASKRKIEKQQSKQRSKKRKMEDVKKQTSAKGSLSVAGKKKRRALHD
ncbi:hypothetical protein T492DRAFT_872233, partial [Pavlovales sp. CCMP2436]